ETCAVLNPAEQARLAQRGIAHRLAVPDLEAAYAAQLPQRRALLQAMRGQAFDLDRFEFGSMGGYYTFAEVVAKLDQLRADFPGLITEKASIGTTWEGRDIWMVEISNSPGVDEGEPEVLYTAIHHAREPQSMTTVLYFMIYLLENYGTDPEVTYLVDNRRMTFVPILNPDGYVYNETTDPEGGGFWRKNRRDNGDGSFGVDPNRNYGFEWGFDDFGSSTETFSDTYRGPGPFSEPETASLRDFVESRRFRTTHNYHSFSNVLIYPWGYDQSIFTPDSARYADFGRLLTDANGYGAGTVNQTLGYVANGNSDDWFYGEQTTKDEIFAFTPEVGSRDDFFWPLPDRIEPLAQANLDANLLLAWLAGGYPDLRVTGVEEAEFACSPCGNGFVDPGDIADVAVRVTNIGLDILDAVELRFVSESDDFVAVGTGSVSPMASDGSVELVLQLEVSPDAPLGVARGLGIELNLGGATRIVPVDEVVVGTPVPRFEEPADALTAWTERGGWGVEPVDGNPAFSDSPGGPYASGTEAVLTLDEPIDLSEVEAALLTFRTRWDIAPGFDYAQVYAIPGNDRGIPLEGRFTKPASEFTLPGIAGQPIYDAVQPTWVDEQMDLSEFVGVSRVRLSFVRTSRFGTGDGWFVDDIAVVELIDGAQVSTDAGPDAAALSLGAPYPNPTAEGLTVPFTLPAATDVRVEVFDLLGRRVAVLADEARTAGTHAIAWSGQAEGGAKLGAGTYLVRLAADGQVQTQRFVLIR
ncbi:MAG: M14 family zinc carboxypeptidase, partial [Bacteroidota bacterium]